MKGNTVDDVVFEKDPNADSPADSWKVASTANVAAGAPAKEEPKVETPPVRQPTEPVQETPTAKTPKIRKGKQRSKSLAAQSTTRLRSQNRATASDHAVTLVSTPRVEDPGSRKTLFRAARLELDRKEYKDVYANSLPAFHAVGRFVAAASPVLADDPPASFVKPSIIYKVHGSDERLEMVVHSSRILTTEQKIVQTAVGNPDILETTVLSPNQVQISAKATGGPRSTSGTRTRDSTPSTCWWSATPANWR